MDKNGYPLKSELNKIKKWNVKDTEGLTQYVASLWYYPDRVHFYKSKDMFGKPVKKLYLSTGGWSGNEDIIEALSQNFIFWSLCWVEHKRGGHYWFEFRINPKD